MSPPQSSLKIDMEVLIREIKQRPILWDVHCDAFKNKPLKNEAWVNLCDAVFEDGAEKTLAEKQLLAQELMLKWKSTRDNFIRTVRKHELAHMSGGSFGKIRKKFYHDDQLSFLLKNRKPRFPDKVPAGVPIKYDRSEYCESDSMEQEVEEPFYVDVTGGLLHEQFEATQESGSPLNYKAEDVFENATEAPDISATSELFAEHRSRNSYHSEEQLEEPGPSNQSAVTVQTKTMNEDEHFFYSMLPSVLKLSATQKMRFRIKVMQAVLEVQENR